MKHTLTMRAVYDPKLDMIRSTFCWKADAQAERGRGEKLVKMTGQVERPDYVIVGTRGPVRSTVSR